MQFVHLHCHSENSLLDGVGLVSDWVKRAKHLEMPAIAITDHGNINGAQQLLFACKQEGIKPIIGCEFYIVEDRKIKEHKEYRNHIVVLAKNTTGYYNLIKLTSQGHIDGFYKKPRIDFDLLKKYKEGLIVLSGCFAGKVYQHVRNREYKLAAKEIEKYKEVFGEDYYIEIMLFPSKDFKIVYPKIFQIVRRLKVQAVITNDCHYIHREDSFLNKILFMIKKKQTYKEKNKTSNFDLNCLWLKTRQELINVWKSDYSEEISINDIRTAMDNTVKISDKIEKYKIDRSNKYPEILIENKKISQKKKCNLLIEEIKKGWREKGLNSKKDIGYYKRLKYELKIIISKNMVSYFLILADVVKYAKEKNILVGFGRGSASGSLMSYLLGITAVDPIKHNLLFERFINESNDSMPDIDVDFDARYRDKIKDYLIKKYGNDKVGEIVTYGIMKLKTAIKDVARVFGLDYYLVNELTKKVSDDGMSNKDIKTFINKIGDRKILDYALKIKGQVRHTSTHPAGLVITPTALTDYVPIQRFRDKLLTGWTEGVYRREITSLGLVKYDILGLKTLSIVADTIKLIKERHNIVIKLDEIKLDNKRVFENYKNRLVAGVFQCESSTMMGLLRSLKPKSFEDIVSVLAIDRPAPLSCGVFDVFMNNKKDKEAYKKFHPVIWDILKNTYGVILYQEQVLNLVKKLASFTSEQRFIVKKLLKKPPKDMMERIAFEKKQDELGNIFIENAGSIIGKNKAINIWNNIKVFGSYSFNRSHSVSYALLSYTTMYLKSYYPLEFYTSLLEHSNEDKIEKYIQEINKLGINLLPAHINKSKRNFTIERNNIRYGLEKLKGIGKAAKIIVEQQPYINEEDFFNKALLNKRIVNKRVVLALIKSGSLDVFGVRGGMIHKYYQKKDKKYIGVCKELNTFQILECEKEVYGFCFSGGLINLLKKQIGGKYKSLTEALSFLKGESVSFYAKIDKISKVKNGIFINVILKQSKSVIIGWGLQAEKYDGIFSKDDIIIIDNVKRLNYKGRKEFLLNNNSKIEKFEK